MTARERIAKALSVATDTKVFEMGYDHLKLVPTFFKEYFPGKKAEIIADCNTWRVAGEEVFGYFKDAGIETLYYIIPEKEFHAEWRFVEDVENELKKNGATAVSVGSGVINDLCKLASHHLSQQYLTIPTAASVDGYSSFGASISFEGLKQTFNCPAPAVIIADLGVIENAPKEMTAAGYADLAAKIPAGAEWMIADLFQTEPIIPEAWDVLQNDIDELLDKGDISSIFEGLVLSGFAMQAARSSRPASCSDHLYSHILDMTHHTFNGKSQSHGFQVAIGTLLMCRVFDEFLKMDMCAIDIDKCVEAWPSLEQEQARALLVCKDFVSPDLGYKMITQKYNSKEEVRRQLTALKNVWPEFRVELRKQCYTFERMKALFIKAGAPYTPEMIGVTWEQLKEMTPIVQLMRARVNLFDLAKRAMCYDELVDKAFTGLISRDCTPL